MSAYATREVLEEFKSILEASSLQPSVTINELKGLSEQTEDLFVDISLETVIFDLTSNALGRKGYYRTCMLAIHIGVDCSDDLLRIFDIVDELETDILHDNKLWKLVTDRDISSVAYDHGKTLPNRGATMIVEVKIQISDC